MDYKLIRSSRRTMVIQIRNGGVIVRAPKLYPKILINRFLKKKEAWIKRRKEIFREPVEEKFTNSGDYKNACLILQKNLDEVSQKHQLPYTKSKISNAKSYWGYCKKDNTIALNWRLGLASEEIRIYVIKHELAHTVHKNHSKKFWNLVKQLDPEYKKHRAELKKAGSELQSYIFLKENVN